MIGLHFGHACTLAVRKTIHETRLFAHPYMVRLQYQCYDPCAHSFAPNCDSVTPLPIAAVDETPPVTVLMRLSA